MTDTHGPRMQRPVDLKPGMSIIPPGRRRPVIILTRSHVPDDATYFQFACESPQGFSVIGVDRDTLVEVISRDDTTMPRSAP